MTPASPVYYFDLTVSTDSPMKLLAFEEHKVFSLNGKPKEEKVKVINTEFINKRIVQIDGKQEIHIGEIKHFLKEVNE